MEIGSTIIESCVGNKTLAKKEERALGVRGGKTSGYNTKEETDQGGGKD